MLPRNEASVGHDYVLYVELNVTIWEDREDFDENPWLLE